MTKTTTPAAHSGTVGADVRCLPDCSRCRHSCVMFPDMSHERGDPFCKLNRPVTVHRLVNYSLRPGDMTPNNMLSVSGERGEPK